MNVTRRAVLALTLLALSAGLCLAGKPNASKRTTVTLTTVTIMPDGAQLQPGDYRMELLNDSAAPQVAFYKHNKLLCKCPVKLESAANKPEFTQALYDIRGNGTRVLRSLSVAGWSEILVFSGPGAAGGAL